MAFIDATRQNFTELPSQTIQEGGRLYFTLPKVGLLAKLKLCISGTMTVTVGGGTATLADTGPWNFIKRIKLVANSGASIFDVSGYGCYLINNMQRYAYSPASTLVDRSTGTELYSAGVTNGANTWKMCLDIPIAINDRDPIGLVLLQNNATQMVLEVEFSEADGASALVAPVVVASGATASFAGNASVMMEYFTVPRNAEDYPALNIIHQWLEVQDSVTSVGAFPKTLLRGNTYMRLMHYIRLNGALNTTDIDQLRILYNQSEVPYITKKMSQLSIQRSRYGFDLPKGTFVHDWYYSNGMPNLGTARDFINSANVTEFQSEVTIASGATLGSGNNFINTISEQLIRIA